MRHPRVLVYETDGRLAVLLRPLAEQRRWVLHEPRRWRTCCDLLRPGGPSVFVLRINWEGLLDPPPADRDTRQRVAELVNRFTMLERVAWLFPDAAVVVVGDADHAALADLAWDLGASYVLTAGVRERLPGLVADLMGVPDVRPPAPEVSERAETDDD